MAPENRSAKLRTSQTYCSNAEFSGVPNGVTPQGDLTEPTVVHYSGWQADTSLAKNVHVAERLALEVEVAAFNLFNRAQFGAPMSISPARALDGLRPL